MTAKKMDPPRQDELVTALISDHRQAALSVRDQTMLGYAVKLTLTPSEIDLADARALRQAGFDDRAIHDICAITAYFAFVNRIADGLGVEIEE